MLQWDLRHSGRVLDLLADAVTDPHRRAVVEWVRAEVWPPVEARDAELPQQSVHGDITDDNVVCRAENGARIPDGVIDFGDLMRSWAVGELAVTVSSLLHHDGVGPLDALTTIAAYDRQRRLSDAEIEALWPLVVVRGAVLVASGNQQVAIDADNSYASSALEREWQILDVAASIPIPVMTAAIRSALGRDSVRAELPRHRQITTAPTEILDLSATSAALDRGRWLDADVEDDLAREALRGGASAVATAFGECRATQARPLSFDASATVATGVDVWFAADTELRAPWPGRLRHNGNSVTLIGDEHILVMRSPGAIDATDRDVEAGDLILESARFRITVVTRANADVEIPDFVVPAAFEAWRSLICDPTPLLNAQPHPAPAAGDVDTLLRRRDASFATVQEHYYAAPPQIERGWRQHLLSTTGRSYLDMLNNVAVLGHGDPEVADATYRQLLRLNTNSRFVYESVVDFSEQLTATLPDPLDTVFLVNSGSEAIDLALRLAMAATGRRDIVGVAEAYHGWTFASDAVSTSVADNPNALSTRPDWVHTVDAPNAYRGRYRDEEAGRYAADAVAAIRALAESGCPPAGFIAEPYYGNAGGIPLPDGYLSAVYEEIRSHGGLAIADEVQVGYGRLGHWFWGFQQQGVIPDIVTIAKAMGNGYPLGAVITSKAVADRYRTQGYFFSSAGGSPVSCVVGSTVLRAIQARGLQANAVEVGGRLKARLQELARKHPIIGAVHGSGLYLGVELVRDRDTREPAPEETARICDRLLDLGVIMQPTSDRQCVLKVKPPLVLERADADFFVDALDHVLTNGF